MRPALKFPPTVIGLYSVLGKHVVREPHLNLGDNKIGGGGGGGLAQTSRHPKY